MATYRDAQLILSDDLETRRKALRYLIDAAFYLLPQQEPRTSHIEQDAFILFQMCSLKCISILEISDECNLVNETNGNTLKLLDPFSVFSLVRSLFEAYCNFSSIYSQSKSKDEITLKYDLWVLSGLRYRQQFPASVEQHQLKKESERIQIENIITSIKANPVFVQLNADSKQQILKGIKDKKWHIIVENDKAHIAHWQEIFKGVISNDQFDKLYSALSMNTHPSNVSVFQFSQLYELGQEQNSMKLALNLTQITFAFLISDYCRYFPGLSTAYSTLSETSKFLIESYNNMRLHAT